MEKTKLLDHLPNQLFSALLKSPRLRVSAFPRPVACPSLRLGFSASLRFLVALMLGAAVNVTAQTRRPMAPADILRIANVSDAQISPNGEWIVYTMKPFATNVSMF